MRWRIALLIVLVPMAAAAQDVVELWQESAPYSKPSSLEEYVEISPIFDRLLVDGKDEITAQRHAQVADTNDALRSTESGQVGRSPSQNLGDEDAASRWDTCAGAIQRRS